MTPTVSPLTAVPPAPIASGIANAPPLMTAEEFFRRHENDRVELFRGIVREVPMPGAEHGMIISELTQFLGIFVKEHQLGRVMTADTFIRIPSNPGNPETVLGADVLFLSYSRWPKEQKLPKGMLEVAPELVVEVRSPSDTWTVLFGKAVDYLRAGVTAVVLVDPIRESIGVYRENFDDQQHFTLEQELVLPDVLPGFSLPVRKVFE